MNLDHFLEREEKKIGDEFLENGYIIFPLNESPESIVDTLRETIFTYSQNFLRLDASVKIDDFFNYTDKYVQPGQLNDLKLHSMALTSKDLKFHPAIYHAARKHIDYIVGNEVCMQRSLNMSVQLPNDESALLPLHTDVWSGNSPYEAVLWMPLVSCYDSKSMYVLPLKKSREVFEHFAGYQEMDAETLYKALEKDVVFVNVPKGHAVLFSHSILHGNIINREKETRWTYNIRFKSAFSPFGTKGLGESFIPINLKPTTRIGFTNIMPTISN